LKEKFPLFLQCRPVFSFGTGTDNIRDGPKRLPAAEEVNRRWAITGPPHMQANTDKSKRPKTIAGGNVAALARTPSDTSTLWATTTTGRVFISKNADTTNTSFTFTRLDTLDANSPGRFVSGIVVDPADPNHAWISYSSYSSLTPATPGHVFSVTHDQGAGTATWTNLDGSRATAFPDFPATAIAFDSLTGDLYVANDRGVLRRANGSSDWVIAGTGLPMVEVAGLTIVPSARKLYAATHGGGAWQMTLP
jgi:hypothetical protein